ncbi:hypothetical protein D3C79_993200 [compost metagenome]
MKRSPASASAAVPLMDTGDPIDCGDEVAATTSMPETFQYKLPLPIQIARVSSLAVDIAARLVEPWIELPTT